MMRYLRTTTFILFLFLSCATVAAQGQRPWESLLEELTAQDDNDIAAASDMYDILIDLEENPININTATRDDLGRIQFLSAQQIEDIEAYVYQYKGMKSVGELSMIESLDPTRRYLLTYFIYIGDYGAKEHFPRLADIVRHGRNELTATGNIPFYDREGDYAMSSPTASMSRRESRARRMPASRSSPTRTAWAMTTMPTISSCEGSEG